MKTPKEIVPVLLVITVVSFTSWLVITSIINQRKNSLNTCIENQRKIGQALLMYVNDNDNFWPNEETFTSKNFTDSNIKACPSLGYESNYVEMKRLVSSQKIKGYAYNTHVAHTVEKVTDKWIPRNQSSIAFPTTTICVFEAAVGVSSGGGPDPFGQRKRKLPGIEKGWERHEGSANYLFCDGHVAKLKIEQIAKINDIEHDGNDGKTPSFLVERKTERPHNRQTTEKK